MNQQSEDGREYPHWNRVYITVIVYTIALTAIQATQTSAESVHA